jgi:hypothetical protein
MKVTLFFSGLCVTLGTLAAVVASAQALTTSPADASDFSLQVSPSPLVKTIQPGVTTELELQIRNAGTGTEALKIEPRSFSIDNTTEQVKLDESSLPPIASWISFSSPNFTILSGDTFTEKIRISVPKDAGFSYSFALVISRQKEAAPKPGSRSIRGTLAVFTLLNVDRDGATRKLSITKVSVSKRVYEYLPAEFSIQFKNNGNTIVQPYGNIFLERGKKSEKPLGTLAINDTHGYILPGSVRTVHAAWKDGFPITESKVAANGTKSQDVVWNWRNVENFRIGKYTAKIVAVYNDGKRDVPIEGTVSFWVIPWKILLIIFVVIGLIAFSIGSLIWRVIRLGRHKKPSASDDKPSKSGG